MRITPSLVRRISPKFLKVLTPREHEIITLRLGLDNDTAHTLQYIGDKQGITRERVRQIENRAFKKMQEAGLSV